MMVTSQDVREIADDILSIDEDLFRDEQERRNFQIVADNADTEVARFAHHMSNTFPGVFENYIRLRMADIIDESRSAKVTGNAIAPTILFSFARFLIYCKETYPVQFTMVTDRHIEVLNNFLLAFRRVETRDRAFQQANKMLKSWQYILRGDNND